MNTRSDTRDAPSRALTIELRDVVREYRVGGQNVRALDEMSLRFGGGTFVSIVGPSGAGKSTLLHLLGALDSPDTGSIIFDGDEIGQLSDEEQSKFRHHRVGFVFQFFNLLPTLSAWENVAVPRLLDGVRLGKVKSNAVRLLDRVGLGNRTEHRPAELSGGQMQRVAVARALMMDPSLILADEPTGNLDSATGASILTLLRRGGAGRRQQSPSGDGDPQLRCCGGDGSGHHPPRRTCRLRRAIRGAGMRPGSAIAASASRLRVFSLRELVVHRRRTTASVAVMAVSAMYLVAVIGIFGSITGSVNRLADGIAGVAALEISGITDAGFPDTITADVAAVPGVATAAPMIRTSTSTASGPVLLFGANAASAALGGALKDAVQKPLKTLSENPNGVQVGPRVGHAKGQTFQLGASSVTVTEVLTGKQLANLNGGHYILAPLALAQNITGRKGQLDSILITTKPGADLRAVRAGVTAAVKDRAIVATPSMRAVRAGDGVKLMNYMALMGAGVALVVGAFLVYTTMTMAITQRRPVISMLRAIGGRRSTIVRDLLAEAVILGLIGGAIGSGIGIRDGPCGDWSIAAGNNPRFGSSGRVLVA